MNFPAILVEHPHQGPGCAWIAYNPDDIINCLAECRYGDNWARELYADEAAIAAVYGDDRDDWPVGLREVAFCAFPLVHFARNGAETFERADAAQSELEFAIEYIGHDLNGLTILESAAEARDYLAKPPSHRPSVTKVRGCAEDLGWIEPASDGE